MRMPDPREAEIRLARLIREVGDLRAGLGLPDVGPRLFETKLDTFNLCNLQCKHCGVHLVRDVIHPRPMSRERLRRVAQQVFPCCQDLCLGSLAEPLMSPVLDQALELGRAAGIPYVQVVTNGLLLDEPWARRMIDIPVDRVSVSADAATPETYARIRNGDLRLLIRNVERLRDLKEQLGSVKPLIRFNFVLLRSTLRELPAMVDLASTLGAEQVDFSLPVLPDRLDLEDELPVRDRPLLEAMLAEARGRMEARGLPTDRLPVLPPEPGEEPAHPGGERPPGSGGTPACQAPWTFMVIGPTGDVWPCCAPFMLGAPPFGNLVRHTLAQILTGPGYEALRRELTTGQLGDECSRCKTFDLVSTCRLNPDHYLELGPRLRRAGT